jgi:hypothetical protein
MLKGYQQVTNDKNDDDNYLHGSGVALKDEYFLVF